VSNFFFSLLEFIGIISRNSNEFQNIPEIIRQEAVERNANPTRSKKNSSRTKIVFNDLSNQIEELQDQIIDPNLLKEFIKDLYDPLSGDPIQLRSNQYLFRCKKCSVFYLKESYDFIVQKNQSKCVSCLSTEIIPYYYDGKLIKIATFNPDFVTLENLHLHVGKSIKFTGTIVKLYESKRGDYALMFEDKPWVEGFKLIVFYPLMKKGKGLEREFLQSLVGKTITVRGLLQCHEIYGYEILIFKRNMILNIQ
jgi:hypothetical protein